MSLSKTEVSKLIKSAKSPEWFNSVTLRVRFPMSKCNKEITGFASIYSFFKSQSDGWDKLGDIHVKLNSSADFFNSVHYELNQFIKNSVSYEERYLSQQWANQVNQKFRNTDQILTYDSPETSFLIKVKKDQPEYFDIIHGLPRIRTFG